MGSNLLPVENQDIRKQFVIWSVFVIKLKNNFKPLFIKDFTEENILEDFFSEPDGSYDFIFEQISQLRGSNLTDDEEDALIKNIELCLTFLNGADFYYPIEMAVGKKIKKKFLRTTPISEKNFLELLGEYLVFSKIRDVGLRKAIEHYYKIKDKNWASFGYQRKVDTSSQLHTKALRDFISLVFFDFLEKDQKECSRERVLILSTDSIQMLLSTISSAVEFEIFPKKTVIKELVKYLKKNI